MRNFVPVLAGDNADEELDGERRALEVRVAPEILAVLHRAEQQHASERVAQHQQQHRHDDERRLEHRHQHRQHQHLRLRLSTPHDTNSIRYDYVKTSHCFEYYTCAKNQTTKNVKFRVYA